MDTLLGRLGLQLLRTQRLPAVAAAWAARVAARQRGWGGWWLLPLMIPTSKNQNPFAIAQEQRGPIIPIAIPQHFCWVVT